MYGAKVCRVTSLVVVLFFLGGGGQRQTVTVVEEYFPLCWREWFVLAVVLAFLVTLVSGNIYTCVWKKWVL